MRATGEAIVARRRIHGGGGIANREGLVAQRRRGLGVESEGRAGGETRRDEHRNADALKAADFLHRHQHLTVKRGARRSHSVTG